VNDPQSLGDTSPDEFRRQLHELADWVADFRQHIGSLRVAPNPAVAGPGAILAALPTEPPEEGEPFEKILGDVDRVIVPGMVHWSHPMFLGYFGWTTTAPAILGEIITAPLSVNAMTWRTCPAATELETLVVDWIRQWVRLPQEFGGVVYDTASVGVMHALAVAREEAAPSVRTRGLVGAGAPVFRIYVSKQAHSSAEKAAIALGLGEENVQRVPTDAQFRMVSKICRENKMWLHIDGAYGAGFSILPENKLLTVGWSEADSIVVNPHKSLFVPLDFSVLYVRDLERLRRVFTLVPEYLRGDTVEAQMNYMDYGIQLGRRFRALKAWVIFRSFGREGMAARLREHIRLANVLTEWIKSDARFELAAPVSMGVVCFRWVGSVAGGVDAGPRSAPSATEDKLDELNSEIVERINTSGRAYLTQTKLRGRTVLRIGLGNVLTTENHLRNAWEMIREAAGNL